jgi:type I restriction enzyme S subunit
MEIVQEFKLTEIGSIPKDWSSVTLGSVCEKIQDGNYGESYPRSHEFVDSGVPFLTSKAIGKDGLLKENLIDFISSEKHDELQKAHISLYDVLFTNRGASVGAIGFVDQRIANGNIGPQLTLLRANKYIIEPFFLYHVMKSFYLRKQIVSQDAGSAMNFFGVGSTKKFLIPLPPSKNEQIAIAKSINNTDKFINYLEKIIEKKRNIKQGVMQQLLKPKDGWIVKKLGEIADIKKGEQLNRATLNDNDIYPVINGGISPSGYTNVFNQTENTIIISEGGNSCGFVNFIKSKFWQGGHCYSLKTKLDDKFLFQTLKFHEKNIMALRVGSGLPNIQRSRLVTFEISIPKNHVEQNEIAMILSDMDNEINSMEEKLYKIILIKQGMMQNLLTGKIRLV